MQKVQDMDSIPGLGRSPGEGNGNPLQYLAWKFPRTEEPSGLLSMGLQRFRHDLATEQSKKEKKKKKERKEKHL